MGHSNLGINLRNINQANLQWNKFFPYFTKFRNIPGAEIAMALAAARHHRC
jgi:hypothetical protein